MLGKLAKETPVTKLSRLDTSSETRSNAAKVPRRAHNRLPKLLDEAARIFAKRGLRHRVSGLVQRKLKWIMSMSDPVANQEAKASPGDGYAEAKGRWEKELEAQVIADLLVVSKGDLPLAEETARDMPEMLTLRKATKSGAWTPRCWS